MFRVGTYIYIHTKPQKRLAFDFVLNLSLDIVPIARFTIDFRIYYYTILLLIAILKLIEFLA